MDAKPRSSLLDDIEALKALLVQHETALGQREAQLDQYQAQFAEQQKSIEQLQRVNEGLSHRLDLALRRLYGRSSEKIDAHQLLLFGRSMQKEADSLKARLEARAVADEQANKKKPGHGRKALPADLPRHRLEHPIEPAELTCPCCNQPRVRIGEEVSEQLDYTPASLFVLEHVRGKYACRQCEEGGVATAAKPAQGCVIEKGLAGPGLVAQVITSKYCDHLPLYRLESILARHGVDLARSTMCGWMKTAGDLLTPLAKLMAERIRGSKVVHTDDTPIDVQQKGRGKTKTGRMWVYIGDPRNPYLVFDYTSNRKRDGPMTWLEGFEGYLQADAFAGYDGIYIGDTFVYLRDVLAVIGSTPVSRLEQFLPDRWRAQQLKEIAEAEG